MNADEESLRSIAEIRYGLSDPTPRQLAEVARKEEKARKEKIAAALARMKLQPKAAEANPPMNTLFLRAVGRDLMPDAVMMTASFAGDPNSVDHTAWRTKPWHLAYGTQHIDEANNNYLVISSFYRDTETGQHRRIKSAFAQSLAIMVDDIGPKVDEKRIALPLSGKVMTSPGNCQGWYLIAPSDSARDVGAVDRLIKGMIASGLATDGKDPGMSGVTRYGRLPVGVNGKAKYKRRGRPFQVRLVEWHSGRRYTIEEIAAAYKVNIKEVPRTGPHGGGALPKSVLAARNADFNALMQAVSDAGLYQSSRGEWHSIECPWAYEHTDGGTTGTAIRSPGPENDWLGGFKCHHGHCMDRTIGDVYRWKREFTLDGVTS